MSDNSNISYQSVQREVLRRIRKRTWSPGELIPVEKLLAEEFGCSRATVNRALRGLAESGILDRKRKAGTRIALNPERRATLKIPVTRLEVENTGAEYRHALLEQKTGRPPVVIRTRLGLASTHSMLHIRALHLSDGRPFQYEDRWVNIEAVPTIMTADLDKISANEWLVQNAHFTTGELVFSAALANGKEAEILATGEGQALFIVERVTWQETTPVTYVRLAYAPGYHLKSVI